MASPADVVKWLQYNYTEDQGCKIFGKELYETYAKNVTSYAPESKPVSEKQMALLIPRLFKNINSVRTHGNRVYKGLKENTPNNKTCDSKEIHTLAKEYGFSHMDSKNSVKYAIPSGFGIGHNDVLKIIEILEDMSWKLIISGHEVDKKILGLQNVVCTTHVGCRTIFNTVSQTSICRGKRVQNEQQRSSRYRVIQEWNACDDPTIETRISSRKCSKVLSFMAASDICPKCSASRDYVHNEHKEESDEAMLSNLFPGASESMLNYLREQSRRCKYDKDPRGYRWDKETVRIALTLWNRSPQSYTRLRDSKLMHLPSESLLQKYKNFIQQEPGINKDMLKWMYDESNRLHTEKHGGLILDEMSVQEDLQICAQDGKFYTEGILGLGQTSEDMRIMVKKTDEIQMAKYILQFIFLGYDGFRFPIAYFPTAGVNAPELYINVWNLISELSLFGFSIEYVCFDGGSSNRSFQSMHFKDNAEAMEKNYTTINPFRPSEKVTLIMDYSHNMKKLRNNIHSSGDHKLSKRKLTLNDKFVIWLHWINAYNWDRYHNPMRVHQKLTDDHIFITKTSKMRNHLAEEVLDENMYNLMKKYQNSLPDGTILDSTLDLLDRTRHMIEIFRDARPICDINDKRLEKLSEIDAWLISWSETVGQIDAPESEKSKLFLTKETFQDLISMLRGFRQICIKRIQTDQKSVVPAGINSDIVENFFCQQRTICHGSTANPNVLQYKYGINSTILSQSAVSKKSNAHNSKGQIHPAPFKNERPNKKRKT